MNGRSKLSTSDRRRLLVARQQLGSVGRSHRSIEAVAEKLSLLHSTDPSTPYLSFHARTDATVGEIDDALYEDRSLLRHTTIRRTVFVMSPDAAALAHGAYNPPLVAKLRAQLLTWIEASPDVAAPAASFLESAEAEVLAHLHTQGAATGNELSRAVPALRTLVDPMPGASYSKPIRITSKVLEVLGADGRIARARPRGSDFTSASWTWAAFGDWAPGPLPTLEPAAALEGLLDRYLSAFGPATVTDMAWWTGLTKTKVRASLASIAAAEVELANASEPGFVHSDDGLVELDGAASDAPSVALLPGLDSTTMGWKQRDWYVDDAVASGWFDRNGNAGPTVWLDGVVIGAWSQRPDGEIAVDAPGDHGEEVGHLLDAEAERTASFLGDVRVKWRYPTPATKRLLA